MEHQSNKGNSIGTNSTISTNECTPPHPGAIKDMLSPYNDMHFTNGMPID